MPVTVHHLNDSRSQRVLWLLEELGIDYEIKHYQRGPDKRAPKELKEVHPLGKSPVITTEDGIVIAESGAIIEYLIAKYGNGKFRPTTVDGQLNDTFWSHFAEGSLMPAVVFKLLFTIIPQQTPLLVRPFASAICSGVQSRFVDPELAKVVNFITADLEKRTAANAGAANTWFAGGDVDGNPTAADFQMLFPLEAIAQGRSMPRGAEPIGNLKQWVAKVHARPAYRAALAKGGPYSFCADGTR